MPDHKVKVALDGPHGEVETLWADPLGNNLYKLDNLPWYAYRVSLEDVVEALPDAVGQLRMLQVVQKSGNRTIRVIFDLGEDGELTFESKRVRDALVQLGCSYEGARKRLIAVNVPPQIDLQTVAAFLSDSGVEWEYADPPHEDLFPEAGGEVSDADA